MTHKHNWVPYEDFEEHRGNRVTRIQREQCSICKGIWWNPIHKDAAMSDQDVDGHYGVTFIETREPGIYDDKLPKIPPSEVTVQGGGARWPTHQEN
jgi:hypothetical protein